MMESTNEEDNRFTNDWYPFEDGSTINHLGTEGGVTLIDIENPNGARITLERDCLISPFAITCGIYGLFFHTHFETTLEIAVEYVEDTKVKINAIIQLYDTPKEFRDDVWERHHDRLLYEVAEMTEHSSAETVRSSNTFQEWKHKIIGLFSKKNNTA